MRRFITRHGWLLAGFTVIVVSSAMVLAGVYDNRAVEPEQMMTLSERELRPVTSSENSGVSLRVEVNREEREWLNAVKLRELGFPPMPEEMASKDRILYMSFATIWRGRFLWCWHRL